jgi:WD40 repeat protein
MLIDRPPVRTGQPEALDADNPWPGLESFREQDALFFRGRSAAAEELLRLVRRERLTVLYSVSGVGKSSLLQAGLFPRLREERMLPVYIRMAYDEAAPSPRQQVLDALSSAAEREGIEAPEMIPGETLWEHFHRRNAGYWSSENLPILPVLVFDQFEEVFTLSRQTAAVAERTARFLDELGELIEGRPPAALRERLDADPAGVKVFNFGRHPYKVLLGIREDFLAELETLRTRIPSIAANRTRLLPLDGASAFRVTQAGGSTLVPAEVGEQIVRLVAAGVEPRRPLSELLVDPALLSLFCRALNERREALGRRAITTDLVEGNRASILRNFYERSLQDLPPAVRAFIEERLLTVGGHRNSEALENALAFPGVTGEAISLLVTRRLLRREEREGRARLELTHDVLAGVVRESRDRRHAEEEIARAKAETQRQREIATSAARQLRQARAVAAGMVVLALGVAVLGVVAWRQRQDAQRSATLAEFREGARHSEMGNYTEALAWMARVMRGDPEHSPSRALALALLQETPRPSSRLQVPGGISDAVISRSGDRVLTAAGSSAQMWDVESRSPIGPRLQHSGRVNRVSFSSDGERLASGSQDGTVHVWDARSGRRLVRLAHGSPVNGVAFSLAGDLVASAAEDGTVVVWDSRTGAAIGPRLRHENSVISVAFSPGGTLLATASRDSTAQVWDVRTGDRVAPPMRHASDTYFAEFSPNEKLVVTASRDNTAQLWDVATGTRAAPPFRHLGDVSTARFSPDGETVVTASRDKIAQLWDTRTGVRVGPALRHPDWVIGAGFSADGRRLLTASRDGSVQLWAAAVGRRHGTAMAHPNAVNSVAFTSDGARILTAAGAHGVSFWTTGSTRLGGSFAGPATHGALSPDGALVVTASSDSTARLWDTHTRAPLGAPMRHRDQVNTAVFSPDGTLVLTASHDRTARLWNARTGQAVGRAMRHAGNVSTAAFSPDGQRVVTASWDSTAQIWDARTGEKIGRPLQAAARATSAAFSPDGELLVTTSRDNTAQLWDSHRGTRVGNALPHTGDIERAAFSPDGERVITAAWDSTAQIWDVRTGTRVGLPMRHASEVNSAVFSPDGQSVVTATRGGSVQFWDARTASSRDAPALGSFIEALVGVRIDEDGTPVSTDEPRTIEPFRRRVSSGEPADRGSFAEFLHRFFSPGSSGSHPPK